MSDQPYDYFHQQLPNKFSHWICIGSSAWLLHILHLIFWKTCQRSLLIQYFYDLASHLKIALHSTQFSHKKNVTHYTGVFETYGLTTTSLSLTPWLVGLNVPVNFTYSHHFKNEGQVWLHWHSHLMKITLSPKNTPNFENAGGFSQHLSVSLFWTWYSKDVY